MIIHNEQDINNANMLCRLEGEGAPIPLGIIRKVEAPIYDQQVSEQIDSVCEKQGVGEMKKLLYSGDTWEVS